MFRHSLICGVVFLTAACEQNSRPQNEIAGLRADVASAPEQVLITGSLVRGTQGPKLAYMHALSIEMADEKIAPRFERAQTSCLEDQSLNCNLIEATITVGDANAGVRPRANLSLRLPHDSVARFQAQLLQPLPGEGPGEPSLRRSSTTAEDLTFQIIDVNRRLNQANDFRDRLTTMLNIDLDPHASLTNLSSPLGQAWRNSARELGRSAAAAFTFIVVSLPWMPLIAVGGALLIWGWRLVRKTRQRGTSG